MSPRARPSRRPALLALLLVLPGCGNVEDPPGRVLDRAPAGATLKRPEKPADTLAADKRAEEESEPGRGAKIGSIAMRTWIYVAPNDRSTKLGYLRAGAVVDRAEASAGTKNCEGGWYRIVPRGYVCVGKGATLAVDHQVVQAALRGPDRAATLPYAYVMSRSPAPHLYFRLPTDKDQRRVEGPTVREHVRLAITPSVPLDTVPTFLAEGRDLPKPYGAVEPLRYTVHAGRAKEESAFGLITAFEWTERKFGLTTELDLIPLDRTKPAKISAHHGVVADKPGVPAIVVSHGATKLVPGADGRMREGGIAPWRSGWILTGNTKGGERGLWETTEGFWLPAETMLIATPREDPVGHARAGKKWIDVSIKKQFLVAYEGTRPVFATLVSTGRGGMSDPEKTTATIRGVFYVHAKHVSGTMDGEEGSDSFDLRDVPYIQYFHEGYALHGAYWHDEFGKPRSHGCVNLAPADAKWLFDWTDPVVPPEWHGAVNLEGGTLVWTHGG
ncbi:L,D-transpeptidase [Polyangium sp. 6x1]|uniref:L,D-transpeptidase n=1 Tax=Polyangium sp. 6x1 TaxID=3042689 RepID=UPI0024823E52|nr:L,D-transpeptidase [Polyangium sp. 6x1]MDI1451098.1 L,D-transpeptidase [Polyangium sp. 6x1]